MRTGPVVTEVRVSQGTLGRHPGLRIKQQHFLKRKKDYFDVFLFLSPHFLTSSRSSARGSISGTRSSKFLGWWLTKLFLSTGESSGQAEAGGVPSTWKILASWSVSYFPGNRGDFR